MNIAYSSITKLKKMMTMNQNEEEYNIEIEINEDDIELDEICFNIEKKISNKNLLIY